MIHPEEHFFRDLLSAVPELVQLYRDHVEFNEGLLGYVALGDMTQHLLGRGANPDSPENDILRRYTAFLEQAFDRYGNSIQDMIIQSFLEFVEGLSLEAPQAYGMVHPMLGPNLRAALATRSPDKP